jgi:hypothetical protein
MLTTVSIELPGYPQMINTETSQCCILLQVSEKSLAPHFLMHSKVILPQIDGDIISSYSNLKKLDSRFKTPTL